MSEIMRAQSFGKLMSWAMGEYREQQRIFGIDKENFYAGGGKDIAVFGGQISTPIGPAAGPHSQLAQNIVAAWLCGSRFIELKTVQKMDGDELRACVPRPCIFAQDEGYNVEWSTELTVPQAFEEYVKAFVAIHVLAKELAIEGGTKTIFNMSVGYDLDGIKTEKIDAFIQGMKNAENTPAFTACTGWLKDNLAIFSNFKAQDIGGIPAKISNSVTLSTLHGCPPDEIERIAKYLLGTKKVHTFVKCNPTLLGFEKAQSLLCQMGYGYMSFDDHHFKDDLQFDDAVAMLQRLMDFAKEEKLAFGVKITNTFPVKITRGTLPGQEMYMSGRALFPLSINVAAKLAQHFKGGLPISYSGGADAFNIKAIYESGIMPITLATTILKPGGYQRIPQLCNILNGAKSPAFAGIDVDALQTLADNVVQMPYYRKEKRPVESRKTKTPLGIFDCYTAPCKSGGCPIGQQIPEYLDYVSKGQFQKAFEVIAIDNAAPSITGTICNHACQSKCTRLDYDDSLQIRQAKGLASSAAQSTFTSALVPPAIKTQKKAAIVGAGPAGIACALFLRRAGMQVTVFEKRDEPFGIVRYVIPAFRISQSEIQQDFDMAKAMGVNFVFGAKNTDDVAALKKEYEYVILAVGAWRESAPAVNEGQHLLKDALAFLELSKQKVCQVELGKNVAVIGGGDVAMDCARAAKRAPGTQRVCIVYRRTKQFMPASAQEIADALCDGVEMLELHAPLSFDGKNLECQIMQLGSWDTAGRRSTVATDVTKTLQFDTVISAIGARVDTGIFKAAGLALTPKGLPQVDAMNQSSISGIYVAGDCKNGPSTVVAAIADAKKIAVDICMKNGLNPGFVKAAGQNIPAQQLRTRKSLLLPAEKSQKDGQRCLACHSLCQICCEVCPNRANVAIAVPGMENPHQILHLDALCNECGNCGVFCPHSGAPYQDKLTLFACKEDFEDSKNKGFLPLDENRYLVRLDGGQIFEGSLNSENLPPKIAAFIKTVAEKYTYYIK